jgi:nucleotide-binding universal stress UspA family protein
MFKRILVPYDGSEPADRALDQAVRIAESIHHDKPEVIVVHVVAEFRNYHLVDRPARSASTGEKITVSQYLKEVNDLMAKSAEEILADKSSEIRMHHDLTIRTKVLAGRIADTIVQFAQDEEIDLIVIGNVGRTGMSRLRNLGSVSRGVSERAPCPVMIVH